MIIHLVDGTYELFRHFYGIRRFKKTDPPFGAVSGVLHTVAKMLEDGATHIGVATDHIIESFRNDLWSEYKTGEGIERVLRAQFHPLEEALIAMGVAVWAMIEFEADDALASAAHLAARDKRVEKICIWTPDKDLAQCVIGDRVVQIDRRRNEIRDAAGIEKKFGVTPQSIPDYLALVGDTADGYPGIDGFGAKSTAKVLQKFMHSDHLSLTFAALADPTRRAILARLADDGEASVTALAEPFDMSMPAISKHLKVLERAGLILRGRDAQYRPCRLEATRLKEVAD